MTLWIFGDSLSYPTNINLKQSWPSLLASKLNCDLQNFAVPGADNFYIYHCYKSALNKIKSTDIVIIGWSHPSRKSFELNRSNLNHMAQLDCSLVYSNNDREFIRSNNPGSDTILKWSTLSPSKKGNKFYDTWFDDYYSDYEQRCHLESYQHSAEKTCPATLLTFYFSHESIANLSLNGFGTMLEFIKENNFALSGNDAHLNIDGHKAWAELVESKIQQKKYLTSLPVIELFDRLAIAEIKFEITGQNQLELEHYKNQVSCFDISLVADELIQLKNIHKNIWGLEKELKTGVEHQLPLEEIGRRAIKIRDWNNKRVALKNTIAEKLSCPVREIKQDHLSE